MPPEYVWIFTLPNGQFRGVFNSPKHFGEVTGYGYIDPEYPDDEFPVCVVPFSIKNGSARDCKLTRWPIGHFVQFYMKELE